VQQVSYGPLIMSMLLIMSCYTGFFNVRRGWQSLNTGPRFYLRLIRRTGWLWIFTSRTTDGRLFKPKKLSVPFLYPGVPAGLTRSVIFHLLYIHFVYIIYLFLALTIWYLPSTKNDMFPPTRPPVILYVFIISMLFTR
jgi:hypothetical protein